MRPEPNSTHVRPLDAARIATQARYVRLDRQESHARSVGRRQADFIARFHAPPAEYVPGVDVCGPECPLPCPDHVVTGLSLVRSRPPSNTADLDVRIGPPVAAGGPYLEQKAKPHTNRVFHDQTVVERFGILGTCGGRMPWAVLGECPDGDQVAKGIRCGRDWCSDCGLDESDAHKRRISRWLPKVRQLATVGHLVMTMPPYIRHKYRDAAALGALGSAFTRLMQRNGIGRGMRAWHPFGDRDIDAGRIPEYLPHIDAVIDHTWAGAMPRETLAGITRGWRRILGIKCECVPGRAQGVGWIDRALACKCIDVHYQYASEPGEKYHRIRYALRPIFKDSDWDQELAFGLSGLRRMQTWGKWDGEPIWDAPESEDPPSDALVGVVAGVCPAEGHVITWSGIFPAPEPDGAVWRDLGGGYMFAPARPPGIAGGPS